MYFFEINVLYVQSAFSRQRPSNKKYIIKKTGFCRKTMQQVIISKYELITLTHKLNLKLLSELKYVYSKYYKKNIK